MPHPTSEFDVAVVGGGPAGSSCAAFCAQAGLRTILLERATFPREKVCGDCLNPLAWPVLDRLQLTERVRGLPHARLSEVEFIGCDHRIVRVPLPQSAAAEIAVRRSALDLLLLSRARELGAEIAQDTTVTGITRTDAGWSARTTQGVFTARFLVAADGRNSSVARLLGLQPSTQRDRVGLQTHISRPPDMQDRVRMQFVPDGYSGLADIGEGQANLCLVARPENIDQLRSWANTRFQLTDDHAWRTITPLSRAPIPPVSGNLLLVGDAARVVEPFTGEGIAYAIASGELAAAALITGNLAPYAAAHARLYRGRLWLNRFAKFACLKPQWATRFLAVASVYPAILALLTHKVVGSRSQQALSS